jgi:hypothetical protein
LYEDLDKTLPEEADEPGGEDEADEPLASGVRMVQLFLDESTIGEFQEACTKLAEEYATGNITDTVMEAVRRASASL